MIYERNETLKMIGNNGAGSSFTEEAKRGITDIVKGHYAEALENGQTLDAYSLTIDGFLYGYMAGKRAERRKRKEAPSGNLIEDIKMLSDEDRKTVEQFTQALTTQDKEAAKNYFSFIGWNGENHFSDIILKRANIYKKAKEKGLID